MKYIKYKNLLLEDKVPIGTFYINEIAQNWIDLFIYLKKELIKLGIHNSKFVNKEKSLLVHIVDKLDTIEKFEQNKHKIKEMLITTNSKFKYEIEKIEKRVGKENLLTYWIIRLVDLSRGFAVEKTIAKAHRFKSYWMENSPFLDVIYTSNDRYNTPYIFDIKCQYYTEYNPLITNNKSYNKLYFPYLMWENANKYFKEKQNWIIYKLKNIKGTFIAVPLMSDYEFVR